MPSIRVQDIFEILIIVFCIYKLIVGLKDTRAMVVLKGVLILFILYNIVYLLKFEAILVILESVMTVLLFALLIVFQPELRKFLERIGTQSLTEKIDLTSIFKRTKEVYKYYSEKDISELSKACFSMGSVKTGALIVLQREIPLTDIIDTGIPLNADVSSELLINTFEKNTPLHDGAVVQIKNKIIAATCYLPLSQNTNINKKLGTRHRAAIGVSEVTDCVVIVVSEETGGVSIVVNGKIEGNLTKEQFSELLFKYQTRQESVLLKDRKKLSEKTTAKKFLRDFNVYPKFLSLIVGFVVWILLINVANPVTTVTFENIPIQFINTSIIEATGKTFEVVSDEYADIKVTDKRTVVDSLKAEDISVIADFSKLSYVNAVPLEGHIVGNNSAEISFLSDDTIIIELDSIISKEFDIQINKVENGDSKYYIPKLDVSTNSIVLTGGKSKIDLVDKVVYSFDVNTDYDEYKGVAEPIIYDRNGDIIDNGYFEFSSYEVTATGVGYPIKVVPLKILVDTDALIGYKVSRTTYEPTEIRIAGDSEYLKAFKDIVVNLDLNLNVDSLSNNQYIKSTTISDKLPEGVYFAEQNDIVSITLDFEQMKSKSLKFSTDDIVVVGIDYVEPLLKAKMIDKDFEISFSGDDNILRYITKDTVVPFIDVTGLPVGSYNLIVQFQGLDDVVLTSNVSVHLSLEE